MLYSKSKREKDISGWDKISENIGGEVSEIIKKYVNKEIRCCKDFPIKIDFFVGYEHSGGLKDGNGKKWWVVWICPECGYQWSWGKLNHHL